MLETPKARARLRRRLALWPDDRKSPVTINQGLELLDMVERLEKENEELRANNYGPEILNDPQDLTTAYFAGMKAGAKKKNMEMDKLLEENRQLGKEADWLAEQILCCIDDNRVDTCRYKDCHHLCSSLVTTEGWREAAREAVKER